MKNQKTAGRGYNRNTSMSMAFIRYFQARESRKIEPVARESQLQLGAVSLEEKDIREG